MTREEYYDDILEQARPSKNFLLRLPTGFGKTRIAIDLMKEFMPQGGGRVLIVVPKLVLIDTWRGELAKWGFTDNVWGTEVVFTTYVSYPKHTVPGNAWSFVVFDECHHFTEKCLEASETLRTARVLCLSATVPREALWRLKDAFRGLKVYSVTAREAMDNSVLPDPKVLLIPLVLDNTVRDQVILRNKSKSGEPITVAYKDRFKVMSIRNRPVRILCTAQEKYNHLSEMTDWWKQQYMGTQQVWQRNNWLRAAKDRLEWLSEVKESYVKDVLSMLDGRRVITFCSSVAQTERLGKCCVNSKNREAKTNLDRFNNHEASKITACGMLNEGVNLTDCQVGLYASISSSEIMEIQRLGRNLRHGNPLIIIPYHAGTREEEIVIKMRDNYNQALVRTVFPSRVNRELINVILDGKA